MNVVDEIKARIDIVELIGSLGVTLRKTGRSFVGFCPFHPNSRTPAFTVYPETQSYYCFGCHAAGTAFDFVMRQQNLDFKAALELLAARAGVQLTAPTDEQRAEDARRTRLLAINTAAARYFAYILQSHSRGAAAREYVARRGLNEAVVESFQLGYSLDEWGHLLTYLTGKKGFDADDVVAAGLAIPGERGPYDRFRGRLIFPIRNIKGEIVGFGGRALGDAQPKYLNTPETPLFKKGEQLFGLDLARDAIRTADRTIVVEGYVDVITAHQYGFTNVVAPLGTALTRAHVGMLKRLSTQVYLALDADAAGQRATLRGLETIRSSAGVDGDGHMVTTAQGVVRLESDVALRIIRMPAGRDPDEVIAADPQQWQQLVDAAVPVMEFYLSVYTAGLDMKQPEQQRQAIDRLMPLVAELDGAQQRVYLARLEQVIGVKSELLLDLLRTRQAGGRRTESRSPAARTAGQQRAVRDAAAEQQRTAASAEQQRTASVVAGGGVNRQNEGYLLALALRHPTVDAAVEALLETTLSEYPALREHFGCAVEDLLEEPVYQAIWRAYLATPFEQRPGDEATLAQWVAGLGEPFRTEAQQLFDRITARPDDLRYRHEAEQCARTLRKAQAQRRLVMLRERIESLQSGTPGEETAALELQLRDISMYAATITQPRRSSTFRDLRDLMGRG
jgi:DNA primase